MKKLLFIAVLCGIFCALMVSQAMCSNTGPPIAVYEQSITKSNTFENAVEDNKAAEQTVAIDAQAISIGSSGQTATTIDQAVEALIASHPYFDYNNHSLAQIAKKAAEGSMENLRSPATCVANKAGHEQIIKPL